MHDTSRSWIDQRQFMDRSSWMSSWIVTRVFMESHETFMDGMPDA
jgi:hypothetical protein